MQATKKITSGTVTVLDNVDYIQNISSKIMRVAIVPFVDTDGNKVKGLKLLPNQTYEPRIVGSTVYVKTNASSGNIEVIYA